MSAEFDEAARRVSRPIWRTLRRWFHLAGKSSGPPPPQRPTFVSMALCPPGGGLCSGAAFDLRDSAQESGTVDVDGWQAEVVAGKPVVMVRGGSERHYDDALASGLVVAQKGLDLMSLRGGNNLATKTSTDEHLVWWPTSSGLTVRIVSTAQVHIDVPPVTLTVTDRAGNVVPPTPTPRMIWHESFRYFRLSQVTDDLFDAYRNAYLALESMLSSLAPQQVNPVTGKPSEGEGQWFRRALAAAGSLISLASHVPAGTTDPEKYLYDELYERMRSAMSHAKSGRPVLLPRGEKDRGDVTRSLQRLIGIYLQLAEEHLSARRAGDFMFAVAFRQMMASELDNVTVHVSDDETPFDKTDATANPGRRPLVPLVASAPAAASGSFVVARLWSASTTDLANLPFVRRFVGLARAADRDAVMHGVLPGQLILGSADQLEVMLGVRGSNTRQPRSHYAY